VGRFLLLSSFSFDSSMVGIFWTLCQGGTLVLPPQRIEQDMRQLAKMIAAHQISHVLMLPSLYAILLEQAEPAQLASLQTVIVAGEECRRGLVDRHYAQLPQATLHNEYGPTEATVWSTVYTIPRDFEGNRVPIGRPIANVQNYILDSHGHLAPIGVPGELCVGGAGVTCGYLHRPELTAERFVEHSFAGEAPIRVYHTGDLARILPDGNIEFLGRIDQQVKIRGFRVELGEIEARLGQHPAIRESVVVAYTKNAQATLVAYLVTDWDPPPVTDDLRAYLRQRLPDYMLPASFILMEEMPLTPNGKIDRKALPEPDRSRPTLTQGYVTPETEIEQLLTTIWQEVLGLDKVGRYDNFFDLGGDSISVMQVMIQVSQVLEIELPPKMLFEMPILADFAGRIEDSLIAEIENLSDEEVELLLANLD
jgi:acyl-coenzyme A synthetase/AMP-(fatty) acid ligase/acyl carrier protein